MVEVAGWGRGRAPLLALLAVVALALVVGRPPAHGEAWAPEAGAGAYAADATVGSENATVRAPDDGVSRRTPDGRPGRQLVAWLFVVLVPASLAVAGWRRVRPRGRRGLPVSWSGLGALAPRAPPALTRPL